MRCIGKLCFLIAKTDGNKNEVKRRNFSFHVVIRDVDDDISGINLAEKQEK